MPWAICTKEYAKKNGKDKNIGNNIDVALQGMNYGLTNGMPQCSISMDFIAEMALGYIDERLSECLDKDIDYRIIRYRDDYCIFTNSKKEGDVIVRELSKILSEPRMRLNGEKTFFSDDIVNLSIKKDKLDYIIYNYKLQKDLRKQLLVIKNLADNYPNSGILNKALNKFDNSLENEIENKKFKKKENFLLNKNQR